MCEKETSAFSCETDDSWTVLGSMSVTIPSLAPFAEYVHSFGLAFHMDGDYAITARLPGSLNHTVLVRVGSDSTRDTQTNVGEGGEVGKKEGGATWI